MRENATVRLRARHACRLARLVAFGVAAPLVAGAGVASAHARPRVLGSPATIVGANTSFIAPGHRSVILGTRHRDVIQGTRGKDWIVSNGGRDVIDGGRGDDVIIGGSNPSDRRHDDPSKLIGGAGRDYIDGGWAADLIVGDWAAVSARVSGRHGGAEE